MATNLNLDARTRSPDPPLRDEPFVNNAVPSAKFAGFPTLLLRGRARAVLRRVRTVRAGGDRGYNVIEAVIIVPVIIVFTLLVVQFALLWHGRHVAEAAAQAAARSAAGYGATAAAGQADGASYLAQVSPHLITGPVVTVTRSPLAVQVTVAAHVLSVIPFGSFGVFEVASAPVETFVG